MKISSMLKILVFIVVNKTITSWRMNTLRKSNILLNTSKNNEQCIISARSDNIYYKSEAKLFIDENKFLSDKKLITISRGGFKGFYLLGILTYITHFYISNADFNSKKNKKV